MYFAIDPTHSDLPKQIAQSLGDLRKAQGTTPLHLLALIDGVFDERMLTMRPWPGQMKYSLYAGTDLQGFGNAAPHVLPAPTDIAEQDNWLKKIITKCAGKPMLGLIASTLEAHELQRHFWPYLVARTDDHTEWPLRWGDARVLPELLGVLEPDQRQHLLSPLHAWWSIQRDGTLISWTGGHAVAPLPADFDKLPLSDKAFARLVDRAEADAVLANIHDTQPDLLHRFRPSECHARVAKHLDLADQRGIKAAGARQHFCLLALSLNEYFTQHPAMVALLQATRQGADYATEIQALPERFWREAG